MSLFLCPGSEMTQQSTFLVIYLAFAVRLIATLYVYPPWQYPVPPAVMVNP